jgi:RNA polymerase sigma-70 factor, ECF subfamily
MIRHESRSSEARNQQWMNHLPELGHVSFDTFYDTFYLNSFKIILRYIFHVVQSFSIAEEITQEIFLKIYLFRSSYNTDYPMANWVWTISRNTLYDYLRECKRNPPTFSANHFQPNSEITAIETETAESILIENFEEKMRNKKVLGTIAALPRKQKQALTLRVVKNHSYQEISEIMNISLAAVKSSINRGKTEITRNYESFEGNSTLHYLPNRRPKRT